MQQTADFFGSAEKHRCLLRLTHGLQLHVLKRVFKQPCRLGQGIKAHRRRTARQRVRQGDCGVWQALVQFKFPFLQAGGQPTRPFVGFIEINVVEGDADTQVANELDVVVCAGCIALGQILRW